MINPRAVKTDVDRAGMIAPQDKGVTENYSSPKATQATLIAALKAGDMSAFMGAFEPGSFDAFMPPRGFAGKSPVRTLMEDMKSGYYEIGYPTLGKQLDASADRVVFEYNESNKPSNNRQVFIKVDDAWVCEN